MPTQQVTLSDQQAEFIRRSVDAGTFKSADDVMQAALDSLASEEADEVQKLAELRRIAAEAFAGLDRGEYIVVEQNEIGPWLRGIVAEEARKQAK